MTGDYRKNTGHDRQIGALPRAMLASSLARDRGAVALLRRHDERGFDMAYERYAENIFAFLVRLSRSRAVAEDLFQQTFFRLAEHGSTLREDSDLRAWLFAVARNAFHSHARAAGLRARLETSRAPHFGSASGPEQGLAVQDVERALSSLSNHDRELLLLVALEELSHAQLAEVLCVDPATVRKRLSRARARLSEALDGEAPVVHHESESYDRVR